MRVHLRCIAGICLLLAPLGLRAVDPTVKLPSYRKVILENGMTVLLMEQHKVPLVNLHLTLRAGATRDPKGKEDWPPSLPACCARAQDPGMRTRSLKPLMR